MDFSNLKAAVDRLFSDNRVSNMALRILKNENIVYEEFRSVERQISDTTLFDIASITKVVSVGMLSLIAMERGLLRLEQPVSDFFPVPEHNKELTVKHLLTHTTGVGFRRVDKPENTYENIEKYILSLTGKPIGSLVEYSCPAYILMGKVLEKVFHERLETLSQKEVFLPLGMEHTAFRPLERGFTDNVNANPDDTPAGIVNDRNCRHLGGVCGNAGLFSCIKDLTAFAKMLQNGGAPLISEETLNFAVTNHTPGLNDSRGIGFLIVNPDYNQTADLFPPYKSFGHCGHTGASFFINRESGMAVILLTDATRMNILKNGVEVYSEVKQMRHDIHAAISRDLFG